MARPIVDDGIHKQVKKASIDTDMPEREIYKEALTEWLKKKGSLCLLLLAVLSTWGAANSIGGSVIQLPATLVAPNGTTVGEMDVVNGAIVFTPSTPIPTSTPTPTSTPAPTTANVTRVAIYGDIHYGITENYANNTRPVITNLITWDPDLVLVLGDIVESRTEDQFNRYKTLAFDPVYNAGIPQLFSCGDHDDTPPYSPWYTWPWAIPYTIAQPWGSYDLGPVHFTVTCNAFGHTWFSDTDMALAQKAWVDTDIGASTKPWKVLAVHTGGYMDPSKAWMYPYSDSTYAYNRALFDGWLRKYPSLQFWAASQHQFDDYRLNGTVYLHAPEAFSYRGYPQPHVEGDFALADFTNDTVRFRVIDWQNVTVYDATFNRPTTATPPPSPPSNTTNGPSYKLTAYQFGECWWGANKGDLNAWYNNKCQEGLGVPSYNWIQNNIQNGVPYPLNAYNWAYWFGNDATHSDTYQAYIDRFWGSS